MNPFTCILLTSCAMSLFHSIWAGSDSAPIADQLLRTTHSWDGTALPAYPEGQPEITILRITIPPGARLATHHHPVISAGVLLSGQLTIVTPDGRSVRLDAGDAAVELVDAPHYGINEGAEPAEVIVFYAGIADQPISVPAPDPS